VVLIPQVGVETYGARRWINPGFPLGFQPSEFAKIAMCIWLAAYCERNLGRMRKASFGFIIPMVVLGATCALILVEPDFGTAMLLGGIGTLVLWVMGTRLVLILLAAAAGLPLLQKLVIDEPYRMKRILSFLDPWRDPLGTGYQLIQSKIAIGSGGLFGVGLGIGRQKQGFLPAATNDFIFSIVAEELGFAGGVAVILVFLVMLWTGLRVALRARDAFGFALALGLTVLLGTQAAVNIAVVTGTVPTKGISLPFVSAGGSGLLASLLAAGILVNIARSEERPERFALKPWRDDMPGYERLLNAMFRPLTRHFDRITSASAE
jgi:cell division protein FtsW